jgi:hypothetical protein
VRRNSRSKACRSRWLTRSNNSASRSWFVEPGNFRTDLLDPHNVKYGASTIADYAAEGETEVMWSGYHGTQQGDPAKLGDVLVKIAGMDNPPKQFLAGSDALAMVKPVIEARLAELRAYQDLSKSTDGTF